MKNRTVALTGSRGFIGQELLRTWKSSAESLGKLVEWPGNILNDNERQTFLEETKPEVIIHLAGNTHGRLDDIFDNNVRAVQKLLQSATQHGVKHIVFSSSGAVYGNTGDTPATESHPLRPANEYGLSKLLAEKLINYYQDNELLTAVILRFSNVYGTSSKKGVVADMVRSIHQTGKIMIDGDGLQRRTFVHVDDAIQAIIKSSTFYRNQAFNIGAAAHSIAEIAQLVHQKYGGEIAYKEKVSDLKEMVITSNKAAEMISFQPQHQQVLP